MLRRTLALAPALTLIALLFGASVVYGVLQSLGYLTIIDQRGLTLQAYANVLGGTGPAGREFWPALAFSLWVSVAATLISATLALLLTLRWGQGGTTGLQLSLAFPHVIWALALLLLLAQSGLVARTAAALGLLTTPAAFPVLVRDRYGIGIIVHYVTKEVPFLLLLTLGVLRTQPAEYAQVAANLGASPWQQLRLLTLPQVFPALAGGALLVFAYVFGAYEAPALLGVRYPRTLAVLALDLFADPDLRARAEGMALGVLMALVVVAVALLGRRIGVHHEHPKRTKSTQR